MKKTGTNYTKRSQPDYKLGFKLQVVQEIEQERLSIITACKMYSIQSYATVLNWLRKHGNFDWENQTQSSMAKTPEQKILELEAKIKLLDKQKAFLEQQASQADKKAIIFDMMIDLAEKEYKIDIRKNSSPKPLINTNNKSKKA